MKIYLIRAEYSIWLFKGHPLGTHLKFEGGLVAWLLRLELDRKKMTDSKMTMEHIADPIKHGMQASSTERVEFVPGGSNRKHTYFFEYLHILN